MNDFLDLGTLQRLVETNPLTYERSLMIELVQKQSAFKATRGKICPWNDKLQSHRPDFSVPRYNTLYAAVYFYWTMIGNIPHPDPARREMLETFIIDWTNKNKITREEGEQLVAELAQDFCNPGMRPHEGYSRAVVGPMLAHWLDIRLTRRVTESMANEARNMIITPDVLKARMAELEKMRVAQGTSAINGRALMRGNLKIRQKEVCSIGTLNERLGGGFGYGHATLIAGVNGGGKCHAKDTPIMLHDGNIKMVQDIQIGDLLMGPDSRPRRVLALARGREEMFDIIPKKGMRWGCNRSHILSLQAGGNSRGYQKGEAIELSVDKYLAQSDAWKNLFKLWRAAVEFPPQPVAHDPYVMGLWLGNGSRHHPCITNADNSPEIEAYLQQWAAEHKMTIRKEPGRGCVMLHFRKEIFDKGICQLEQLKRIATKGDQKVIPRSYLINSRQVRLHLLAGLLDTDGYQHNNHYEITTVYPELAEQILFLARSLGYAGYSSKKTGRIKSSNFEGTYTRITLSGDFAELPVKVARKKTRPRKMNKSVLRVGFRVESRGMGDYYGFTLEGDGLYLLGDFTVTHNTVLSTQLARDFSQLGHRKVAYVTTEQPPTELMARIASNHLQINYNHFTARKDLGNATDYDREVSVIPQWIWDDPQYQEGLKSLEEVMSRIVFLDWSQGKGQSIAQNLEAELDALEATDFDPDILLIDWIGGGLDKGLEGKIDLRLVYQQAADWGVSYAKRRRKVVIEMAQFDRVKAMGKSKCGSAWLSECKTMGNNMTNFVGISAAVEDGSEDSVFSINQFLYVEKSRDGTGGNIPVERHFHFQRFRDKAAARNEVQYSTPAAQPAGVVNVPV